MMFVDWNGPYDDEDERPFGDENTVRLVVDPVCEGPQRDEPLGEVPEDGPVQFFGED